MHDADEAMARITAERLVGPLERSGLRGDAQAAVGRPQGGRDLCRLDCEGHEIGAGRVALRPVGAAALRGRNPYRTPPATGRTATPGSRY